ncbi:MAG: flagellar filament capping protein FliD, partial [Proteobacteria bacterium]|nr:flagellar filament capping protein FliD [Pseudomonadota bacterium]
FLSNIKSLGSSEELRQKNVSTSSDTYFSVTAGSDAQAGSSYQVEVVSLAQVQKDVSQGYADKSANSFGTGELTLSVGANTPITITLDETNNSLEGIMKAINDTDSGVNASIINDGTDSPYRLVLSGEDVANTFSLTSNLPTYNGDISAQLQSGGYADQNAAVFGSGTIDLSTGDQITLGGETNSLQDIMEAINGETGITGISASIVADGDNFVLSLSDGATITTTDLSGGNYDSLSLIETQGATQAHIRVDTIDIYSNSNTIEEAIPGLSLDLVTAEEGKTTNVTVSLDEAAIRSQIEMFVKGYNDVVGFIDSQSTTEDSNGGILGGEATINTVKRRFQGLLTSFVDTSGNFSALSQLGLKTQKDGTLELDDFALADAIHNDLGSIEKLLVGEGETEGIAAQFQSYLEGITDSRNGLEATNKRSTESIVENIENRMEQIELRLVKREETMRNKFNALELLISGMNSQGSFLTQQMDMLNNMTWNK